MHEFVYGWQAIVNTMSMKNNVEVRKRAGLQRFALAGINGITLISHIGVTEIMINGTRTYCFGGVSRPPGRRSVICKVDKRFLDSSVCQTKLLWLTEVKWQQLIYLSTCSLLVLRANSPLY